MINNLSLFIEKTNELFLENQKIFQVTSESFGEGTLFKIEEDLSFNNPLDTRDNKGINNLLKAFKNGLNSNPAHKFIYNFKDALEERRFFGRWIGIFESCEFSAIQSDLVFNYYFGSINPILLIKSSQTFTNKGKIIPFILKSIKEGNSGGILLPIDLNDFIEKLGWFSMNQFSNRSFPYLPELLCFLKNNSNYLIRQHDRCQKSNQFIYTTLQKCVQADYWQDISNLIPGLVPTKDISTQSILEASSYKTENVLLSHSLLMESYRSMGCANDISHTIDFVSSAIMNKGIPELIHIGKITQLSGATVVGITHTNSSMVPVIKEVLLSSINYYNQMVLSNIDLDSKECTDNFSIAVDNFLLEAKLSKKCIKKLSLTKKVKI